MNKLLFRFSEITCCAVVFTASQMAAAGTLCVNKGGTNDCFSTIQAAVNHAAPNDVINVKAGTYAEEVTIGIPLSIIGAGANATIIDATNLAHGVFVDGFDNPGLHNVIIAGLTVQNALFEGIIIVSASDVTIRNNHIVDNDKSSGLQFTGAQTGCPDQPGDGVYENDETGDCGGALHLIGTANSIVSGNLITGNADGVLISDETAESHNNLITRNIVRKNPLECGIVLASHPPTGHTTPPFAAHFGVDNNTVAENISDDNGVQVGGAGAGLFSDGAGQGRVSGNVIVNNELKNNGLGGVALHTHVGPAFGLPADDMSGNAIIGNIISGNLADQADTATPGRVGININSGGGGSPVYGTVISGNDISNEDVDVAVNTPAEVDVHLNDLLGHKLGVADVCALDGSSVCTGSIDATENYWGCITGPGSSGCSKINGSRILFAPWLGKPADN
ncbi:MAG: right-handed parallel beta-helix repeat-containing protein [Terriglobales bacterium]